MRLIDADRADIFSIPTHYRTDTTLWDVKKRLEDQPTIEAEPVKRGWWIGLEYDGYADGYPVYDLWECSECGEEERGGDVPTTHPYCHGCGAKMDLEEETP